MDQALRKLERGGGLATSSVTLLCLIETPLGVERCFEVADRLAGFERAGMLAFGAADYSTDMGQELTAGGENLDFPRHRLSNASHAAGLLGPIDSPYMYDLKDQALLHADARRARGLGYMGKLCLHPNQVDVCNKVFSPTSEELAFAREVIDSFEAVRAKGQGYSWCGVSSWTSRWWSAANASWLWEVQSRPKRHKKELEARKG